MPIPEHPPADALNAAAIRQVSSSISDVLTGLSTALEQARIAQRETDAAMDDAHECAYFSDEALEGLGEGLNGLESYVARAQAFLNQYGIGSR